MLTDLPLAFLGTYPPRRCGIATFTRDLREGVQAPPNASAVAVTDPGGEYEYPEEVKYEIRQGAKGDYARAAEVLNYSDVRLCSIQHEYGIFGGDDGSYVLDFLAALRMPAMTTLHTVLKHPTASQRGIVERLARGSAAVVVMSQVAADLLRDSYGVRGSKVHIIPHGIPTMTPRNQQSLKAKFGVPDRRMLLTFGLLGPNKGIETVIRALPSLIAERHDVVYFVVGATHPAVVRQQGEAYRTGLEREAEELGIREHVVFRDQFVTSDELADYLQAADIFISPYLSEAQVTSGALSCAMGAGAAVVSTPYWHARELLADGRGCLFPFGDSRSLGKVLESLLDRPSALAQVRAAAHAFTRSMVWPNVGRAYAALAARLMTAAPPRPIRSKPSRTTSLPELRLDHLARLTDDTGIIQHASHTVPVRRSGYCVDDNARALIVALLADRVSTSPKTRSLVTTYLGYLHLSQEDDGSFRNLMTYSRVLDPESLSEDCAGRAAWALGSSVRLATDDGCRLLAQEMLERFLPRALDLGPRGGALTILGLVSLLEAAPGHAAARTALCALAEKLVARYQHASTDDWHWFEPTLTYDNAMLPLALFRAFAITGDRSSLRVAREGLEFLEGVCFDKGKLMLVGNAGWHMRGGPKPCADEQAVDAAAFVLAFRGAYQVTGDHHYLGRMRQSFAWFLGANRLGLPLYDFATAGCRDGLGATTANRNQGAESTISFLLALLEMHELAGEGLEHAEDPEPLGPAAG